MRVQMAILLVGTTAAGVLAQQAEFQGLGFLDPADPYSVARDVNADGTMVVGYSSVVGEIFFGEDPKLCNRRPVRGAGVRASLQLDGTARA